MDIHRMMISHEKKFIFIHVPKTAGWSVYQGLAELASDGDELSDGRNRGHCHDGPDAVREWIGAEAFGSYFKFCFVRNPWDREVSQYFFDHRSGTRAGFAEFIARRSRTIDKPIQRKYARSADTGRLEVDFIGRFERLQNDFNRACWFIGCEPPRLVHNNRIGHPHYTDMYDPETLKLAERYLWIDAETFGYSFIRYRDEPGMIGFVKSEKIL